VAGALREVIRKRIDDKVENGGANGKEDDKIEKKDMVEELLEAEGGSFSEEEMVDFCLSLLVAGYETTSVLMTLAVKFLTETPTALAQLKVCIVRNSLGNYQFFVGMFGGKHNPCARVVVGTVNSQISLVIGDNTSTDFIICYNNRGLD
jgi:hypothetical protein